MFSWRDVKTAFAKKIFSGRLVSNENIIEPKTYLQKCALELVQKIGEFIYNFKSPVKLNCMLACEYLIKKGENVSMVEIFHHSKMASITISDDFVEWFIVNVQEPILTHMSEFQERDSGKALHRILYLQVRTYNYFLLITLYKIFFFR